MRIVVVLVLSVWAALVVGVPLGHEVQGPLVDTGVRPPLPEESQELTSSISAPEVVSSPLPLDPSDLQVLMRTKRNYYGRGDPWGRDRIYGRRRQNSRVHKKYNRGRIRYFFDRKKPRNDGPPEHEDIFASRLGTSATTGYTPRSIHQPSSAPPPTPPASNPRKSSGIFVSARSSGIARVEQTVG